MTEDERYMTRALALAAEAGFTSPNPRVGAVIVRGGSVLGEGAHRGVGSPHAEVVALRGTDAKGATLYVNLEPCTHHGTTPPCAPTVADAGIQRVVVGGEDPDPRVAGTGIAYLRGRGIEVEVGVLAADAAALNDAYIHHRRTGRPLVTLKLALTLDGKLAASDGSSQWITGESSRRFVHERRALCDAILIGAGTVVADDPRLTVREVPTSRQPARVVVDATGRVAATSRIFGDGEAIVMTTIACPHAPKTAWKEAGAEVVVVGQGPAGGVDLRAVIDNLAARGWTDVYCEGGAAVATSLLKEDLVDRLALLYGPLIIGGDGIGIGDLGVASLADARRWRPRQVVAMGTDALIVLERNA